MVLDEAVEEKAGGEKVRLGMVVWFRIYRREISKMLIAVTNRLLEEIQSSCSRYGCGAYFSFLETEQKLTRLHAGT